ncbi:MAG TPA: tetratricopeptide repeat protein [Chthonomonadales bacterium]|nr:tetratricopeptide repeat protein [Chthonomonadales bacterium]
MMEEGEPKMFCSHCGTRCSEDANFCKQCGHKLDKPVSPRISEEDFVLPASTDETVSKLLVEAFRQFHAGETEGAMKVCQEVLVLEPNSTTAHSLLGMIYEKQGERDKAIAAYETVLRLNPGSIADREKLEQLRGTTTRLTPPKIISVRRTAAPALFDSPAGAAVVAVGVTLLALMIGGGYVWWRASMLQDKPGRHTEQTATAPTLFPPAPLAMQQAGSPPPPFPQNTASAPAPSPIDNSANTRYANPPRQNTSPRVRMQAGLSHMEPRPVRPATVSPPELPYLERDPRFSSQARGGQDTTIHLPDTTVTPSDTGTASNEQAPQLPPDRSNQWRGWEPSRRTGKIEIVVAPEDAGAGKSASPSEVKTAGVRDGSSSTLDSRARRDLARRLQLQGQYRRAATEYTRALDGAGDDAGLIHQQIALCYQRLDDKESAINHYKEAIAEYKKQISAGRNIEAAQRGIQAAEMGIRACK